MSQHSQARQRDVTARWCAQVISWAVAVGWIATLASHAGLPAHRGLSEDENALVPISPVGTADYLADDFSFGLDIDLAGAAARPSALRPT